MHACFCTCKSHTLYHNCNFSVQEQELQVSDFSELTADDDGGSNKSEEGSSDSEHVNTETHSKDKNSKKLSVTGVANSGCTKKVSATELMNVSESRV